MQIDINCDLGEGFPNDARIMPFISSANIACGAHAGDDDSMRITAELAIQHNVHIGAHPGYRDKNNFGRTEQALSPETLYELIAEQIHQIRQITAALGGKLHHVKPHGALYNLSARSMETAATIARAVYDADPGLYLYGLSGSCSVRAAIAAGLPVRQEVFADRRYDDNGQLLSRKHPDALIENTAIACRQVGQMIREQTLTSLSGKIIPVVAETICIHGDAAGASHLAAHLFHFLQQHDIQLLRT